MTRKFTYTQARARFASLCKDVTDDSDYVIITRQVFSTRDPEGFAFRLLPFAYSSVPFAYSS